MSYISRWVSRGGEYMEVESPWFTAPLNESRQWQKRPVSVASNLKSAATGDEDGLAVQLKQQCASSGGAGAGEVRIWVRSLHCAGNCCWLSGIFCLFSSLYHLCLECHHHQKLVKIVQKLGAKIPIHEVGNRDNDQVKQWNCEFDLWCFVKLGLQPYEEVLLK